MAAKQRILFLGEDFSFHKMNFEKFFREFQEFLPHSTRLFWSDLAVPIVQKFQKSWSLLLCRYNIWNFEPFDINRFVSEKLLDFSSCNTLEVSACDDKRCSKQTMVRLAVPYYNTFSAENWKMTYMILRPLQNKTFKKSSQKFDTGSYCHIFTCGASYSQKDF